MSYLFRKEELFANGNIHLSIMQIHTTKLLEVDILKGRLTVVTSVSGSGKTTMILESLVPALEASISGGALPEHIRAITAKRIQHIKLIDATPIGINVCYTVATYAGVHDELRKLFAKSDDAKTKVTRQVIFPITLVRCTAPVVTERELSALMCSFFRM